MSMIGRKSMRELIAEGVIGLSLCAGAYFLLVDPVDAQLRDASDSPAQTSETDSPDSPAVSMNTLKTLRGQFTSLLTRGASSPDDSSLNLALMQRAAAAGVVVDSVRPIAPKVRAIKAPAQTSDVPGQPSTTSRSPADRVTAYALDLTGDYAAVQRFVASLQNLGGYGLVRAIRMTPDPTPGSTGVRATIETEHITMDTSVLARFLPAQSAAAQEPK